MLSSAARRESTWFDMREYIEDWHLWWAIEPQTTAISGHVNQNRHRQWRGNDLPTMLQSPFAKCLSRLSTESLYLRRVSCRSRRRRCSAPERRWLIGRQTSLWLSVLGFRIQKIMPTKRIYVWSFIRWVWRGSASQEERRASLLYRTSAVTSLWLFASLGMDLLGATLSVSLIVSLPRFRNKPRWIVSQAATFARTPV